MLTENKTMVTSSESENVLMKDNAVRSKLVNNDFLTKKLDLSSLKVAEIMVTRTASQSLDVTKKGSSSSQVKEAWPFLVRTKP